MMKTDYQRFTYTATMLIVDANGDLTLYSRYEEKARVIDKIRALIGADVKSVSMMDVDTTFALTQKQCRQLTEILEEA